MPAAKAELGERLGRSSRRVADRRNLSVDLVRAAVEPGRWHHLRDDADGLRISVVDLPPGVEAAPLVVGAGGAYAVVVSGVLTVDGARFEPGALRWLDDGWVLEVAGGGDGVRIAVLQYPRRVVARAD